jgi:hypothetical protein
MTDIFVGQYSVNAIRLDRASLDKVEDDGGYQIDLWGLFKDATAKLELVSVATTQPYLCYGARSGMGYTPKPKSPFLVSLATPPLPPGVYNFRITQGGSIFTSTAASTPFNLTVVRRNWHARTLAMRRVFPPWYKLGPRYLDTVGLLT